MIESHRLRHLIIYVSFAAVVVGSGLLAAYGFTHSEKKVTPFVIDWVPPGKTEAAKIQEIATYTQGRYLLGQGLRLVAVMGEHPSYDNVKPVAYVQIDSKQYPTASVVAYELCGDGQSCQMPGTSNTARGCVISREAFELAYQTFRYVPTAQYVTVLTPFQVSGTPVALMFNRDQWGSMMKERLPQVMGRPNAPMPSDSDACKAAPKQGSLEHIALFGFTKDKKTKDYVLSLATSKGMTGK